MNSSPPSQAPRRRAPLAKKLAISLASVFLAALALEIGARVVSYVAEGFNAYYLFYGFRSWTDEAGEGHSVKLAGYFKFPPSRTLMTYGRVPEPARINNHGFRGADFEAQKPPGVFRVVALGESSTFGYEDRDQGTYPFLLEQELARDASLPRRVEVLNCGIPHATSANLAAMFEAEIVGYAPDLVTWYAGYNDAVYPVAETRLQRVLRRLDEYSAAYAGVRKLVNKLGWSALQGRWSGYRESMDRAALDRQVALHEAMTRANLRRVLELARARGIGVILIQQTMTAWFEAEKRGLAPPRRTSYADEHRRIVEKLEREGRIHGFEARLYIHERLMQVVAELAREHGLPLLDNRPLVDEDPERFLVSSVHLSEAANERLAREIGRVVRPLVR